MSILRSCFSLLAGGAIGYFLWEPLISIPLEIGRALLLPLAKLIDPYLSSMGAGYVTTAIMAFSLNAPNTVFLSLLAVLVMKLLKHHRMLFYPVFLWPILVYTAYWIHVWRLKIGAQRLGLPSDMHRLPIDVAIPHEMIFIFLTYTLFSLIVVLVVRRLSRPKHNSSLHIVSQASQ